MKAAILLLCLAALAHAQQAPAAAPAPEPVQRITIQLRGAPEDLGILAEHGGDAVVELHDNGAAVREGWFEGPPRRSVQLRLFQRSAGGESELYSGLAMLGDRSSELLAFSYQAHDQQPHALRVPASPPLHLSAGAEPVGPYRLALGWGALVLGYLGVLVVGWAVRGRRLDRA